MNGGDRRCWNNGFLFFGPSAYQKAAAERMEELTDMR